MPRFTIKDLRETIARYNRYAMLSGSTYYYKEQGRNGYQAVDLYRIEEDGRESRISMLEGGISRECAAAIESHYGYTHPQKPNRLTRDQALRAVEIAGADITEPFHAQMWDIVDLLTVWAKRTGYRKPRNANGSTGRYFWEHLQRLHHRHQHKAA